MNNPLVYTDPSGELAWFVPVIAGAVIGFEAGGWISSGTPAFWKWEGDDWKAAGIGAMVGAAAGGLTAAAIGPAGGITGMITTTTVGGTQVTAATTGWGLTSSSLMGANLNMLMSGVQFGKNGISFNWDINTTFKSGIVGAASGIFTNTGGFGLIDKGLGGKLAYQAIGTTGCSIGNNWAAGEDLFSKVTVGIGPVNLVFGKNVTAGDYLWANAGNIAFNTVGLANLAFGGDVQLDKSNLTAVYSGGFIEKAYSNMEIAATGAHSIFSDTKLNFNSNFYRHEVGHLWHSRAMGNSFLANYFGQGLFPALMNKSQYYVNWYEYFAETWFR